MPLTVEERQDIIDAACEKALLLLPTIVGNLIVSHVELSKLTSNFYKEHPEFVANKAIVQSVIELVEGRSPGARYEDLLREAVPEIRERIRVTKDLDTVLVSKTPSRTLSSLPAHIESTFGEV